MDLRRLTLDFVAGTGEAVIVDSAGERVVPLAGAVYERIREAAVPAAKAVSDALREPRPASDGTSTPSDASYWQHAYDHRTDGWELGRAAPPLQHWFAQHSPKGERALVVGCGRGHEARMLARAGAKVTAIDFAPSAIAEATQLTAPGEPVTFRQQDLFTLGHDGRHEQFDLVVEHTCYCAIEPKRRAEYVEALARVQAPGAMVVGLFRVGPLAGGPPFATPEDELVTTFASRYELVEKRLATDSVPTRQGGELLAIFRRR